MRNDAPRSKNEGEKKKRWTKDSPLCTRGEGTAIYSTKHLGGGKVERGQGVESLSRQRKWHSLEV